MNVKTFRRTFSGNCKRLLSMIWNPSGEIRAGVRARKKKKLPIVAFTASGNFFSTSVLSKQHTFFTSLGEVSDFQRNGRDATRRTYVGQEAAEVNTQSRNRRQKFSKVF